MPLGTGDVSGQIAPTGHRPSQAPRPRLGPSAQRFQAFSRDKRALAPSPIGLGFAKALRRSNPDRGLPQSPVFGRDRERPCSQRRSQKTWIQGWSQSRPRTGNFSFGYQRIAKEVIASIEDRLEELMSRQSSETRHVTYRRPLGGGLFRVGVGLLLIAGLVGGFLVWQGPRSETVARWAPQSVIDLLSPRQDASVDQGSRRFQHADGGVVSGHVGQRRGE